MQAADWARRIWGGDAGPGRADGGERGHQDHQGQEGVLAASKEGDPTAASLLV